MTSIGTFSLWVLVAVFLSGCSGTREQPSSPARPESESQTRIQLLDVRRLLVDDWTELLLKGRTEYHVEVHDGAPVIRAVAKRSASGLIRSVEVDVNDCPIFHWNWKVNSLQRMADIRVKGTEDVAASVFLLFGDPGILVDPDPVPTLRYVWSSEATAKGSVIDNPYLPGVVKSLVVQSGSSQLGQWITETRNVQEDFARAFGELPGEPVQAIAVFTDNDQTWEQVEAFYGSAWSTCVP